MKLTKAAVIVTALFALCLSAALFAQDMPEEETITKTEDTQPQAEKKGKEDIKLNTVVITATKTEERIKDVPMNIDVITSEDLEATGATTLGDAIGQKITGHYHRYSGMSQPAGIQANFTADEHGDDICGDVLVLVDGHRLGTGNIGKVPPEIIERVEVIKGPASALYGSAAMGGVINIITKKGKSKIQNTAKAEFGSFDYMRTALTSGGNINNYMSYFLFTSLMKVSDYKTKSYGKVYNTNENQAQLWGNVSFYPSQNQSFRLGFSYADIESHYPQWQAYEKHTYYDDSTGQYSDKSRGHVDLEYNTSFLKEKINWNPVVYFLWDRNSWYSGSYPDEKIEDDATIYNDYTVGTDQKVTLNFFPWSKIVVGYTFESLRKKGEGLSNGVDSEPFTPDLKYITNGIYAQDSINLLNNSLNIIVGARYDRFDLSSHSETYDSNSKSYDNITPRGGVVYKITDFIRIRANVGQAFKTPSADQLTAEHRHIYGNYLGNPDLKPEKSTTYDGGFDVYFSGLTAGATFSKIKTKDKIVTLYYAYTDSEGTTWSIYDNIGKSDMEIVDCYVDWSATTTFALPFIFDISSALTINKKYENEDTGEKLPFVADKELKSNVTVGYKAASTTLSHVYIGHELRDDGEQNCSFYFFNLTAKYDLSASLTADIGIYNLTDEDYEWVDGYPMPERNYKIGLTGKF
ncbi:MAG: TonB-dependent receptor [Spirochaetes bacterium]|nr:TonB-dependent receptor [Spirochaetota bacterium]